MTKTKPKLADIFALPMDERVESRIPSPLKQELEKEAKKKGYPKLSKYLLWILVNRPK